MSRRRSRLRPCAAESLRVLTHVELDDAANAAAISDVEIGAPGAPARTLVLEAGEDFEIARGVRAALAQA